ncbi:glycoside hydrolase family 13 protein [Clostridium aestuarii]|uniref:Glycoside hydrolase family 13 protein n=1 Tax=Clostridium aestuarii TaxID=338193 RepID=A0ABT4CY27_9CLOT|nr:glycoside hydrolase family 13 protein [Clostridium aestuarii]MCY6483871.1 glycoside hydrolase family 13 protein [Clostridium aestuarii]
MMDFVFFDSQDLFYKQPFGAVYNDGSITIKIQIDSEKNIDGVNLVVINDKSTFKHNMYLENTINNKDIYISNFNTPYEPTILFYYFEIITFNNVLYYGNNKSSLGGIGEIYESNPVPYQITVYDKISKTPSWFKNAVIYQIFVDRFFNGNENGIISNPKKNSFIYANWNDKPMYIKNHHTGEIIRWDFYGGNLKGIIKKLDYLKELGINTLYLNPVFEAVSNHKYDTGDYKKIDSMLGDYIIFKELVEKARKIGMYIILDGVFSHTGSDSIYFNQYNSYDKVGAYQSKYSPYYNWYNFKKHPHEYDCWWGVKSLPCVNEMESSYLDYIVRNDDSVINYWMDSGIKGWRLDVADELPDKFIEEIKKTCLNKDNESILLGEVWEDASNKISYGKRRKYLLGSELDSVTNYPFRENLLKFFDYKICAVSLHKVFMSLYENYPIHNFYANTNVLGTHDVERLFSTLKMIEDKHLTQNTYVDKRYENHLQENKIESITIKLLKLITLIQFTFPGIPLIYYGDEVGIEGLKDPYNRATYPWGSENKEILNWYKKIIKFRNKNSVFRTGAWKSIYFGEDIYGYIRSIKNSRDIYNDVQQNSLALVLINRSITETWNISVDLNDYEYSLLTDIFNDISVEIKNEKLDVVLNPLEGKLFMSNNLKNN